MPDYLYRCKHCSSGLTVTAPMGAAPEAPPCSQCGEPTRRDWRAAQIVKPTSNWGKTTFYDRIPDDVRGAGPNSREYRDYAQTVSSERMI